MPMIATTTRWPSWSASGSSAVTVDLGDVEAGEPRRRELLGEGQLGHGALDDGLQGPARRLLDQQLGRLPALGEEDAVDVLVLDRGAGGGLVVQGTDGDVDVEGLALRLQGRLEGRDVADDADP